MKTLATLFLLAASLLLRAADAPADSCNHQLYYTSPAAIWEETLPLGFPVPAVVTGGTHMSAVHAGSLVIIGGYCLVLRQVGVGQELVCTAFTLHQFFGSEFPGYPVGYL